MKNSNAMQTTSSKPRRQRKAHYARQLHSLGASFSAHLSPALRKQIRRRSLTLREGDTVKVMRGDTKVARKQGKVTAVMRTKMMVLVEGITRKKVDGTEKQIPLRPSNLMIIELEDKDSHRLKTRKKFGTSAEKPSAEGKER